MILIPSRSALDGQARSNEGSRRVADRSRALRLPEIAATARRRISGRWSTTSPRGRGCRGGHRRNARAASQGCVRGVVVLPPDEANGELGVAVPVKRVSGRSHARLRMTALLAGVSLSAVAVHAQDATWTPPSGASADWNTASNWTPGTVPANTAFFGAANAMTVTFASSASINTLQFNVGAPL